MLAGCRDSVGRTGHLGVEVTGLSSPGISRKTSGLLVPSGIGYEVWERSWRGRKESEHGGLCCMTQEFGLHPVECTKPLKCLNQEDSRCTYVPQENPYVHSSVSLMPVRVPPLGVGLMRVRSGVNREETWSSEPSGLKPDYSHPLCATLSLFSCQIWSGHQTCLEWCAWKTGCLFQRWFQFQEESHTSELQPKGCYRPGRLCKINATGQPIKSVWELRA